MSGNISEAMIIGIAIIMVASLVSTGLNLMVMSNSLLSGGTTTLQSGIDSISTQEFASFDNTKVSGTQVTTALSQFQGRDIAVVVQTKAFASIEANSTKPFALQAINYGAILCKDGKSSAKDNLPTCLEYSEEEAKTDTSGKYNFLSAQAKTAFVISFTEGTQTSAKEALYREKGAANYTGYLHNTAGLVDSSYDVIGTTELGNAAYILSSARFSSVLIKDPTGSIIGIFFKQLS